MPSLVGNSGATSPNVMLSSSNRLATGRESVRLRVDLKVLELHLEGDGPPASSGPSQNPQTLSISAEVSRRVP